MTDADTKREQVLETMRKLGPLEPAALASAEPLPKPPVPLRPGQPVRWTSTATARQPSRRRRGVVVSADRMVAVLDERTLTIGYHRAEELEPTKRSLAQRLERENARLLAHVCHLEAIRDATIGLMADGGNQYIDRLHELLRETT